MRDASKGIDYDAVVQVVSFSLAQQPGASEWVAKNPSVEMTLAEALHLVCSREWADAGNVLGKIVRTDGPPILTMQSARDMMNGPNFPGSEGVAGRTRTLSN